MCAPLRKENPFSIGKISGQSHRLRPFLPAQENSGSGLLFLVFCGKIQAIMDFLPIGGSRKKDVQTDNEKIKPRRL